MKRIETFDLAQGRRIGTDYVVEGLLGGGWEGEVYEILERRTGARRAAKLFFPQRNLRDRAVNFYARKLEHLRDCELLIKYHHSTTIQYRGQTVTALISEYVEGTLLEELIAAGRGGRLPQHEALSILYTLSRGLEKIHARRDYHGDLHDRNIMVRRRGVFFDLKLVDLYNLGRPSAANIREDVIDSVRLLYDMLGGQRRYASQRQEIKAICCGLKRSMIERRFPTASHLRRYLESFEWSSP